MINHVHVSLQSCRAGKVLSSLPDTIKAQGITYVNEVIPYVHYSWVVHIYICCLNYDTKYRACNTCCHSMPVFVTGGRFRPLKAVLDNCPIRDGRGLLLAVVSHSHTLEKSRSKEERPAQAIFRQMQTDASRRRRTGRQSALLS